MRLIVAGLTALLVACASPRSEVQPLVDAAWLNEHLDDVIVLDIRSSGGEQDSVRPYETGHIPGAISSEYSQGGWRVTRDGVPYMAPSPQDVEEVIGALGVSDDDYVVIVSAGTGTSDVGSATRVYWQFKVLGHEQVSILNGGHQAWTAAGLAVSSEAIKLEPVSYSADYQLELVATREDVIAALESGVQLIDARSSAYYTGASKSGIAARAGTIAGAKNVPAPAMIAEGSGVFVDSAAMASLWAGAGAVTAGEQIMFCNIGHFASVAWFASYEVLGNKQASLYDGSMAEWSADPELPMENTLDSAS